MFRIIRLPWFAAGTLLSLLLFAATATAQATRELVIVSTGGAYGQALQKHFYEPFFRETGIRVTSTAASQGEQWAKIKAMVSAGSVSWDMFLTSSADVYDPDRQSLLASIGENCEQVSKAKSDGFDDTCHAFGPLLGYGATLFVNHKGFYKQKSPQSWVDFWNVKDFPGSRALGNFGDPWRVLIGALLADGVASDKLFPLDLPRAFKKLDEIKPHVVLWWKTGDQIQRAFREGEVASGLIWSTRTELLQRSGVPLERIWDGATLNLSRWSIVKGAPNEANAVRFLNWFFDNPQNQTEFCREVACAPPTKSAVALFPESEQKELPTYPANRAKVVNLDLIWLARNLDPMATQWNQWLASSR